MSKSSNKQLYTQSMEWLGTMNIQRKKHKKQSNSRMGYYEKQGRQ